jgi:hypothetical protein
MATRLACGSPTACTLALLSRAVLGTQVRACVVGAVWGLMGASTSKPSGATQAALLRARAGES